MRIYIAVQMLICYLAVMLLTGCGNTRFYVGIDDYGEPKEFHHDFKTRGNGDGDRVLGKTDKRNY